MKNDPAGHAASPCGSSATKVSRRRFLAASGAGMANAAATGTIATAQHGKKAAADAWQSPLRFFRERLDK